MKTIVVQMSWHRNVRCLAVFGIRFAIYIYIYIYNFIYIYIYIYALFVAEKNYVISDRQLRLFLSASLVCQRKNTCTA